MIVTCPTCTTRLQLDDSKIPARAFSVRCPKCEQIIDAEPPAGQKTDATDAAGKPPVSTRPQQETNVQPPAAMLSEEFQPEEASASRASEADLMRLLATLMQRAAVEYAGPQTNTRQPDPDRRRALLCLGSVHCDAVARGLAGSQYQVFVAKDTAQAMEHMREEKMDVVVLDNEFDMMAQGTAFISRELNTLRMVDRRRVLLVQLSTTARTGDAHAAFLNNANLIVNNSDVEKLPHALEKNIRELNDLYRHFNKALNQASL
ncbi:MAG: zinc-ribbon domain-containing protein [Acidobacteria bacterium]|nr:zinc-ribbon domain-containing protein [Acidobacteriota bacterium]